MGCPFSSQGTLTALKHPKSHQRVGYRALAVREVDKFKLHFVIRLKYTHIQYARFIQLQIQFGNQLLHPSRFHM